MPAQKSFGFSSLIFLASCVVTPTAGVAPGAGVDTTLGGPSGSRAADAGGLRGGGGMGADGAAPPSRGPAAPQAGVRFPFPQNREQKRCIYPTRYLNEDVRAAYAQWKADTVTTVGANVGGNAYRRVQRTADPKLEPGSTVSEGIAYGMLIAVYMGDQALFDDLWKYEQSWLDQNGLMDWYINAAGTMRLGTGAATDADEDMAFALLMADRQWGGGGSLPKTYIESARQQITRVWDFEVFDYRHVKPGDGWGDASTINISYFAPYYYRLFAGVDSANTNNWNTLLEQGYDTLSRSLNQASGNQDNGLVPAWSDSNGTPNGGAYDGAPTNYQYDSCRTPFRIGMDWCLSGEARAKAYVDKTSAFFSRAGGAAAIVDGYELNGKPRPELQIGPSSGMQSAAFVGPAAVGAMVGPASLYQGFIDQAYRALATRSLLVGGVYYDSSWTVLSLLMMTGNLVDFTAQPASTSMP